MYSYEPIHPPLSKIEELENEEEREIFEVICQQLAEKIAQIQHIDDIENVEIMLKQAVNTGMMKIMYDNEKCLFLNYYSLALGRYVDPYTYLSVEMCVNN